MNERETQRLLEMTREAERLERDLLGEPERSLLARLGSGGSSTHAAYWRAALAAAVALGLSLAAGWLAKHNQRGTITTIASRSASVGGGVAAGVQGADHATMLIALFAGDESSNATTPECWCLQRIAPTAGGDVVTMAPEELLAASMEQACVTSPTQVVVIGLSGPREHLPASDDEARTLARCLLGDEEHVSGGDVCLASTVDMRVQRWSNP